MEEMYRKPNCIYFTLLLDKILAKLRGSFNTVFISSETSERKAFVFMEIGSAFTQRHSRVHHGQGRHHFGEGHQGPGQDWKPGSVYSGQS